MEEYLTILRDQGFTVVIMCDDAGYHAILVKGESWIWDDLYGVGFGYTAPTLELLILDMQTSPKLKYVELY